MAGKSRYLVGHQRGIPGETLELHTESINWSSFHELQVDFKLLTSPVCPSLLKDAGKIFMTTDFVFQVLTDTGKSYHDHGVHPVTDSASPAIAADPTLPSPVPTAPSRGCPERFELRGRYFSCLMQRE